ncbi:MAG: hypothetical protein IPM34_04885 [Saprospiraceae bacterium]|nr:hypothetical protein [Saprospiraceae bacterium]
MPVSIELDFIEGRILVYKIQGHHNREGDQSLIIAKEIFNKMGGIVRSNSFMKDIDPVIRSSKLGIPMHVLDGVM